MKRLRLVTALVTLISLLGLAGGAVFQSAAQAVGGGLQFVPLVEVAPDTPAAPGSTTTPDCTTPAPVFTYQFFHCYTPADMAAAYGVDRLHGEGITGAGQTIVIVDSYGSPTALSDLQFFSSTFGLPAPNLTIVYPNGKPTYNTKALKGAEVGWAEETSLDLEWAHAMAPDANLVLIAANPAETEGVQGFPSIFKGEQYAIAHYPGAVISQSFAVTEQSFNAAAQQQVAKFDQVYQQAVAAHMTVVSATGDSGTANTDKQGRLYPYPTAQWPASDPLVTAAGGTWLQSGWTWDPTISANDFYGCLATASDPNTCLAAYLNSTSGGKSEAVWKEDWLPAATGGGLSTLYATPSFQSGLPASLLQGHRGIPDLSWNAAVDGGALVYVTFPGVRAGWHVIGGTSAATPQIAATIALANQLAASMGKGPVGYLNPLLYQLPASAFNDTVPQTYGTGAGVVTLDSNAEFGSGVAGMSTTTGWDLTTGFGSPSAYNFVHDLVNALP